MFTGLIEAVGTVVSRTWEADHKTQRWLIAAPFADQLELGESVCVNGVCLTVVEHQKDSFAVQLSPTTLALSTLGQEPPPAQVNLERAVTPTTRLGGHWLLGHVDTRGQLTEVKTEGQAHHLTVHFPAEFSRWVMPLGSIAVDGVSLTIVERATDWLRVTIIPHTWQHTTLGVGPVPRSVNLEFDIVGKYVEQLVQPYRPKEASPS